MSKAMLHKVKFLTKDDTKTDTKWQKNFLTDDLVARVGSYTVGAKTILSKQFLGWVILRSLEEIESSSWGTFEGSSRSEGLQLRRGRLFVR